MRGNGGREKGREGGDRETDGEKEEWWWWERDKSKHEGARHTSLSPGLMISSESEKLTECGLYFLLRTFSFSEMPTIDICLL